MSNRVKVLFIYPDFWEQTKNVRNIPGNYSEGLASISAVLKQAGHSTVLYHMTYMPEREEFCTRIREEKPDIIGMSIRTDAFGYAKQIAAWLDEFFNDIPVMAGMYHASLAPEEVIAVKGIDAVCIGEGEYPCRDFVNYFAENKELCLTTESFWVKDAEGTIHRNPIRAYITSLDELPFPDLDLFDYSNLYSNVNRNTAEVIVSRGCLYSCTYCANAQLRNLYPDKKNYARYRSPENAIGLLEQVLAKDPKIERFSFNDAILNMYEDWFYAFTALYKEKIGKRYVCNLRFDLLNEKMIKELAESGCYLVTIGLENGNEQFRTKYLQRTMKNDHMIEISHMLKKAGIIVNSYNIIGLPHETLKLSLETIKLNAQMHTDSLVISYFQPFPATKLREIALDAGFIDPDVKPGDPVKLRMPGYPRSDIIYIRYSFMKLMRQYRKLYKSLDGEKLEQAVAKLDKKILSKRHPRGFIGAFRKRKHQCEVLVKRAAAKALPSVYRGLRSLRDKRRSKDK